MIHLVRTCLVFLFLTLAIFALCATARRFKVRVADDGAPTKYGASLEKGNDWEAVKDALDWEEEKKTLVVDLLSNGDSTELAQRLLEVSKKMSSHMSGEGGDAQVRSALVSASGRVVDVASSTQGKRRVAVIGAGLSGLTTAKRLLEEGVHVLLVDKNVYFGGNSAKASSGINGCPTEKQSDLGVRDSAEIFFNDTMKSSRRLNGSFTSTLVRRMVDDSSFAVEWIASRAGIEMDTVDVGQLGGHSRARTHRPKGRLAGAAFISGLERAVLREGKTTGLLTVMKGTRMQSMRLLASGGWELDLVQEKGKTKKKKKKKNRKTKISIESVAAVVLATGGYGHDKGPNSLLRETVPHLEHLRSTNGNFATGDGIKIAREIGAGTVDMEMVQVHPTGFSDPPAGFVSSGSSEEDDKVPLILCAEIIRGVGGVLLKGSGHRFVDELETRKHVVSKMNATGEKTFVIALPPGAAERVQAHIHIYTGKKLLHPVDGARGVAEFVEKRLSEGGDRDAILKAVEESFRETSAGEGQYRSAPTDLPIDGTYHVGVVQPVLHYTMGGLKVDADARVLSTDDTAMPGLFAAGEIMGGVHGVNRLGGSSLLDCVVFGLAAARSSVEWVANLAVGESQALPNVVNVVEGGEEEVEVEVEVDEEGEEGEERVVDLASRSRVQIGGTTYDITDFLDLHPGGKLLVKLGEDLTERFTQAHGDDLALLDRDEIQIVGAGRQGGNKEKGDKPKEHRLANYGGKGGGWREILGRHAWFFFHSIAAKYPDNPTEQDKQTMRNFVAALGQHYPCKLCRGHLQQQLRDPELGPVRVNSRQELSVWFCELHNLVNRDIGKKQFDCSPFKIDLMYLKDCGGCEVKPKNGIPVDPKTQSGYHPYLGPWNPALYSNAPAGLLETIASPTDSWETEDLLDLIRDAVALGAIHRKKDLPKIQAEISKGPEERRKWAKRLENKLDELMDKLNEVAPKKKRRAWLKE